MLLFWSVAVEWTGKEEVLSAGKAVYCNLVHADEGLGGGGGGGGGRERGRDF